jgi:hypothetical protein
MLHRLRAAVPLLLLLLLLSIVLIALLVAAAAAGAAAARVEIHGGWINIVVRGRPLCSDERRDAGPAPAAHRALAAAGG